MRKLSPNLIECEHDSWLLLLLLAANLNGTDDANAAAAASVFINLGTAKQVWLLHWGITHFDCNENLTCFSCKSNAFVIVRTSFAQCVDQCALCNNKNKYILHQITEFMRFLSCDLRKFPRIFSVFNRFLLAPFLSNVVLLLLRLFLFNFSCWWWKWRFPVTF